MQSILDNSSPNFLNRPLPDTLFSDEEQQQITEVKGNRSVVANATTPSSGKEVKEAGEGIKLRLKLEKSETVNYVAVVNLPGTPKATCNPTSSSSSSSSTSSDLVATGPLSNSSGGSSPATEPRVPPLHISLKGRNLAVLSGSPKKEIKQKKKSRSRHDSGEEEEFHRGKTLLELFYECIGINFFYFYR